MRRGRDTDISPLYLLLLEILVTIYLLIYCIGLHYNGFDDRAVKLLMLLDQPSVGEIVLQKTIFPLQSKCIQFDYVRNEMNKYNMITVRINKTTKLFYNTKFSYLFFWTLYIWNVNFLRGNNILKTSKAFIQVRFFRKMLKTYLL